jgi:hypothetical protein
MLIPPSQDRIDEKIKQFIFFRFRLEFIDGKGEGKTEEELLNQVKHLTKNILHDYSCRSSFVELGVFHKYESVLFCAIFFTLKVKT